MKFTNRLISILLCVLMLSAVACLSVSAKVTFPVGDWVYEKINNDTQFEVDEYKGSSAVLLTPYSHNLLPITSIGSNSFDGNETLTQITLTKNVTAIQSFAFLNCTALTTVAFRDCDVNYIGYGAFSGCRSLANISLENTSITAVEGYTFLNCNSLSEVVLPDTVTTIKDNAFAQCNSLSKITIPASVTAIGEKAFSHSDNVVIYCYKDSTAHNYAETNSIEYVLLDETPVETYILGDADGDEYISVLDASVIQLYLVDKYKDTDGKMAVRGDCDKDDILSVMDAARIQLHLVGVDDNLGIGNTFEY